MDKLKKLIKIFLPASKKLSTEEPSPEPVSHQASPEPKPETESSSPLVHIPNLEAEIIELEDERYRMQENQLLWPFRPPALQQVPEEIPVVDENRYWEIARKVWRWALPLLCVLFAAIPPYFVFQDRWLENTKIADLFYSPWSHLKFLDDMWWPAYFLVILPVSILAVVLIVFFIQDNRPRIKPQDTSSEKEPAKKNIRSSQRRFALSLEITAIVWAVIVFAFSIAKQTTPGISLLAAIFIYLLARVLTEHSFIFLMMKLRKWWLRFWPVGLSHLALILFLADFCTGRSTTILTFGLLAAALINLWKHREQVNTIHWITLAAVFLFALNINSWVFSTIGDEYGFFTYGQDILQYQNWDFRYSHIFNGMGVYGSHPYLSSVIQALSMNLLGINNFGWRFSSIYLAAISIPMFYFFFRRFLDERVSLLGAGMLGCSHYIMTFGKIGYNNLQALFVMGLVLWAAGEAVRNRSLLNYTFLGLSIGMVFYVYPAAFYVLPLAGVLLLMYDPPVNRFAIKRWWMAGISFFLLFSPLLFQPDYWHDKISGTLFYNPEIIEREGGIAIHLVHNFLYSLYSFIYIPNETHYVVSSYVDPLSGALVLLGLAWVFKLLRRDRFAIFLLLGFFLLNFFVGATHDRLIPSNTRMFLLLPWFTVLAALGLSWLTWQLQRLHSSPQLSTGLMSILLCTILVGNLYQAYTLSYNRNLGQPNLEVLFLRMLQRDTALNKSDTRDAYKRSYLFITDEGWDIGGLRVQQNVYGLPDSETQLYRVAVSSGNIPVEAIDQVEDPDVGVIVYPYMEDDWRIALEIRLSDIGKKPCVIRNTPGTDPRFTIWWSDRWIGTCPANGNWSLPN
jgi:4-amino-4-deoxy-L-arabinose transferase-like glycosyltransferase